MNAPSCKYHTHAGPARLPRPQPVRLLLLLAPGKLATAAASRGRRRAQRRRGGRPWRRRGRGGDAARRRGPGGGGRRWRRRGGWWRGRVGGAGRGVTREPGAVPAALFARARPAAQVRVAWSLALRRSGLTPRCVSLHVREARPVARAVPRRPHVRIPTRCAGAPPASPWTGSAAVRRRRRRCASASTGTGAARRSARCERSTGTAHLHTRTPTSCAVPGVKLSMHARGGPPAPCLAIGPHGGALTPSARCDHLALRALPPRADGGRRRVCLRPRGAQRLGDGRAVRLPLPLPRLQPHRLRVGRRSGGVQGASTPCAV